MLYVLVHPEPKTVPYDALTFGWSCYHPNTPHTGICGIPVNEVTLYMGVALVWGSPGYSHLQRSPKTEVQFLQKRKMKRSRADLY